MVATPETPALREARFFLQRLATEGMPMAGLVVNRVTPDASAALEGHAVEELRAAGDRLLAVGEEPVAPEQEAAAALLHLAADRADTAARERHVIATALAGIDPRALVEVPVSSDEIHDLDGLTWLGGHLMRDHQAVA